MKKAFFPRLAWTGIKSNRKLYLPYILTCTGMVAMFYIIVALACSPLLEQMRGGGNMTVILTMGKGVIAVFALIFLFYTNSFLIRRRKKEFGLYNILGMNKKNIFKILAFEALTVAFLSLVSGLVLGIILSKAAELGMLNILHGGIDYSIYISKDAIVQTLVLFAVIFLLIYLNSLRQMLRTNPLELLRSENAGEKPPKGNILFALAGAGLLIGAYYIAVTIKTPLDAMGMFFVAVIMVIVATYLLFISGSVVLCRFLQRRKGYYYKPNHFVSVSSMAYRMKRNGAGLASICILSTMVLVMISSTSSLYFGENDILNSRYPRDIMVDIRLDNDHIDGELVDAIRGKLQEIAYEKDVNGTNIYDYRTAAISGIINNGKLEIDIDALADFDITTYDRIQTVYIVPLEDYNRTTGSSETLASDEALLYCSRTEYNYDTITIGNSSELKIKSVITNFEENGNSAMDILPSIYIVVADFEEFIRPLQHLVDGNENNMLSVSLFYGFDTDAPKEVHYEIRDRVYDSFSGSRLYEKYHYQYISCDSLEDSRTDFYTLYGGLFFIGIMLSIVFIFATVLIIYYKQVSEGYEDRSRFEVMQKVGMTKERSERV